MERQLAIGEVFSRAYAVYGDRAKTLIPLTFCLALVVSIGSALLDEGFLEFLLGFLLNGAFFALVQAVAIEMLKDARETRGETGARELLASALPRVPVLLLAGVAAYLAVIVGFVFLIVPGLYLLTIWSVLLPVILVERKGIDDAFGRSRQLVRGHAWRVFGVVLLLCLLLVVSFPLVLILQRQVEGSLWNLFSGSLVSALIVPYEALVLGVLYFRLLDLESGPSLGEG